MQLNYELDAIGIQRIPPRISTSIYLEESVVSLKFRRENVLFPRRFKNTVILKRDIADLKLGSHVVVNFTDILMIFLVVIIFLSANVAIFPKAFSEDLSKYIIVGVVDIILVNLCFFRFIFRMRMIIVNMKDGSRNMIPWKGNLLSRVSSEEKRIIEEISIQLKHDSYD